MTVVTINDIILLQTTHYGSVSNMTVVEGDCRLFSRFIILTEVWINSHEVNLYKINDHNSHSHCNNDYRSGGVVVYTLSDFQHSIVTIR